MNINMNIIRSFRLSAVIGTTLLIASQVAVAGGQFTERFDFEPGQTLNLELTAGGSVKVEGWDQAGIEVTYGDKHNSLDVYKIDIQNTAAGLSVDANTLERINQTSLFFEFKAPRQMNLKLYTAGGGVELSGLAGEFSGKTGGGALRLDDLTGEVDLRTGGGRILVKDSTLDGKVRTGGGKALVENVTGDIHASSGGGTVTYRNVYGNDGTILSPNKSKLEDADEETVLISNAGGKIKVEAAPAGADVYTGGGNIRVNGADRFVSAKTGGGDVEIELLAGWVKAQTGAGEVEVFVAENAGGKGDISLTSGNGDILLTLPADFSMDLYVELGVTNNSSDSYTLNSDFDIDITTDDEWNYSRGTPRKYTIGRANLNGGSHRVSIKTTNGNVKLRKAN